MKKIFIAGVVFVFILYAFKKLVYDSYQWKKAINSPEHKLQLGSFIFSKQSGSNGSQSMEHKYFIFKVIEINGDYVKLSVVRQLSQKNKLLQSDFSTTKEAYKDLKQNIGNIKITGILKEDLYKAGPSYTLNNFLLEKYPSLLQSRYYFEEIPENKKNLPIPVDYNELQEYFSLVYSKDEIINKGKLVPWVLNNNTTPELAERLSQNIDLILN
ncbi:hypothetical protein [Flavobacterium johnsoniae]|jgi:hypothetical protein|uniref:Uncharacterized protein n=1 Tax=Flavobacterium johnsoniae (strain ATCC 17061 / DSM 2064 / JCM 8514 / BCRC 14874 / CCUG 350202 / NBRC 14942 / NCIMB 11054 / UW101) TaxID=376686 RepID=A5FEL5_FLAJ1|nr:hypothetical protein [Flavobacterium johnsoniae]ABQ06350.1 hypothetical protein Fjoh_3334 [Flavobacterium johnsoniae UW101]OXE95352.1 hypothetical protein B0A63_24670 [Flavobacterium johnsoniae UW101]WQG82097.1 hypothetical protein SR927_03090 [Flavobacterium johnsoniae UW101]SHK72627.1 hypothetical protein SAMN05444146_2073 [Flavobacterium johnsoniae]